MTNQDPGSQATASMEHANAQSIAALWKEMEEGHPEKVLEAFDPAPSSAPTIVHTLHGLALYEAGRHEEAVGALEATLAREPQNAVAQLFLVLALFQSGKGKEAGDRLLHHTIILPHHLWLEAFLRVFWPMRFTSSLDRATPLPDPGEWQDPFLRSYEKWKATHLPKKDESEEAGAVASNTKERTSFRGRNLAEKYIRRAESAYMSRDLVNALRLMQRAHEVDPQNEYALANLSYLYLLTGRRREAFDLLDPLMGERLRKYDETQKADVLPQSELLVCYAWALHEQERHEEALRLLAAAQPEGPEDLGAHFVAAVCWLMLGREEEFRAAFQIATTDFFIDTWEQLLLPFIQRTGAWLQEGGGE